MTPYAPAAALPLPRVWDPLLEVIQSHPRYEEPFVRCIGQLFYGEGPLRVQERHYVALMAASRHRCSFMVNLFEREFEACGGELGWLKGLAACSQKRMQHLDEMNRLLAHQPWLFVAEDIRVKDGNGGDSPTTAGDGSLLQSFQRFTNNLAFTYVDFYTSTRNDTTKTFNLHEFSWDQHGYMILEEQYQELIAKLDDKFNLTQTLTYKTMGEYTDVDTSSYRMAVWNYIQALFGIRHDDYDYSEVNTMLSKEMKTFIKTVACYPHRVTEALRTSVMTDFKNSEKVHVMLMVMEARLQSELLYFTRTLTNYDRLERTMLC
ncbi:unnamed protein product, partial [Mesorhabditis spiculigera]